MPRELVLDASVGVKFEVPEEGHRRAVELRGAFEEGRGGLSAPSTMLPEVFNAFWQKYRRDELTLEEVRESWSVISALPLTLYAPEDLVGRGADMALETGMIIYDALFLALAEGIAAVVVTADDRLLGAIEDTAYEHLARPLSELESLLPEAGEGNNVS